MNANIEISRMPGSPNRYAVSTGGGTYEVDAERGTCSCPAWQYRCSQTPGTLCKHGKALQAHLDAERFCERCGGKGVLIPRLEYAGDDGRPLPCVWCEGTGLAERMDADLRDAELKRLFA